MDCKTALTVSNPLLSPARFGDAAEMCNQLMIVFSWLFMVLTMPFSLVFAVKWVQEYLEQSAWSSEGSGHLLYCSLHRHLRED